MSNSVTVVVDALVYLLNCELKLCVAKFIQHKMLRKEKYWLKYNMKQYGLNQIEESYSSDTIEDLHLELEALIRRNINNFFNIIRLIFKAGTLTIALQTYGIQISVAIYCFQTIMLLLFHIVTFVGAFVETSDTWTCYQSLSDEEMKPIFAQYHRFRHHVMHNKKSEEEELAAQEQQQKRSGNNTQHTDHHTGMEVTRKKISKKKTNNTNARKVKKVEANMGNQDEHEAAAEVCPICLSAHNIETVKLKVCQHQFHEGCLLCLLRIAKNEKAKKCPICRALIIPGGASTAELWHHDHDEAPFHIPHM